MPVEVQHTRFQCSICGQEWSSEERASLCEKMRISRLRFNLQPGDVILLPKLTVLEVVVSWEKGTVESVSIQGDERTSYHYECAVVKLYNGAWVRNVYPWSEFRFVGTPTATV